MSDARLKQLEEYLRVISSYANPAVLRIHDLKMYAILRQQNAGDQTPANESLATDIIAGIRGAITVLHPLLQSLVEGSKESRKEFRAQFKTGELFEFSNSLHHFSELVGGLCSEKALEVVAGNGATEVAHG